MLLSIAHTHTPNVSRGCDLNDIGNAPGTVDRNISQTVNMINHVWNLGQKWFKCNQPHLMLGQM